MKSRPKGAKYCNLTAPDLEEIERMAREPCRGPLLALVAEVRRLREAALGESASEMREGP